MSESEGSVTKRLANARLDQNTLVPLGVVVSLGMSLFGAHSWMTARFDALDRQAEKTRIELTQRLERIEETTRERWLRTEQRLWASELARRNPTLVVPDIEPVR